MEIIDAGRVRIGVSATRIDGIDYVDVRVHKTDSMGLMRPTPSGLPIPLMCLQQVIDAMQREKDAAEQFESPTLYYFKEQPNMERTAHMSFVTTTAKQAVMRTPEEYMADSNSGYLFKCNEYELVGLTYRFLPTKPFAVWNAEKNKWVRCEKRKVEKQTRPKSAEHVTEPMHKTAPLRIKVSTGS